MISESSWTRLFFMAWLARMQNSDRGVLRYYMDTEGTLLYIIQVVHCQWTLVDQLCQSVPFVFRLGTTHL